MKNKINEDEEWKQLIVCGKEHPWYIISNYGTIKSYLCNGKHSTKAKIIKTKRISDSRGHKYVGLYFPKNFFEDTIYDGYSYRNGRTTRNIIKSYQKIRKDCYVHQLVMWTFKPIDEHPPKELQHCWNDLPLVVKNWITKSVFINHIDHDPGNNHVDNLEYVTPMDNTRKAVVHYGGNLSNKGKLEDSQIGEENYNFMLNEVDTVEEFFYG